MPATLMLNGLTVVSVRLFQPWQGGPWTAEVDFDLEAVPVMPIGPVTLKIGTSVFVGTIDPDASGKFGEKGRARVIAGGGGWHRPVASRQFHNDAGVLSPAVIMATAAEVGEAAVVAIPKFLGVDYERVAGPASRVLAGLDWYVTPAGVTTVAPRVPAPGNPLEIDVLSWDAHAHIAEIATDEVLSPGTILVDPRFGTLIVRDVEQTFDAGGARATARIAEKTPAGGKLAGMLASAVRELGGLANLKTYRYRVVAQNPADGRLTLQAISRQAGAPDSLALPAWYGVPGLKAELITPGSEAAVVFLDGDPAQPAVVAFKGGDELATGVATQASQAAFVTALATFATALQAFCSSPIKIPAAGTAEPLQAAGLALAAAAAQPAAYSLRTKAV